MKLSGLFAIGDHLKRLSETGDPLETVNAIIDFEAFRPVLLGGLAYSDGTVAAIARKVVINTQTVRSGPRALVIGVEDVITFVYGNDTMLIGAFAARRARKLSRAMNKRQFDRDNLYVADPR